MNIINNPVKQLTVNTLGRDFVIGDLHGARPLLNRFMDFVNFDTSVDRLISVGDLVDRGPESMECLDLVDHLWFHCVRGNHEQMMLEALFGGPTGPFWIQNGGGWWSSVPLEDRNFVKETFVKPVDDMPLLLTVPMANNKKFHVVHAELVSAMPLTDEDFAIDGMLDNVLTDMSGDGETAIWGRSLFGDHYASFVDEREAKKWLKALEMNRNFRLFNPELSVIFSGHTIMCRPTNIGSSKGGGGQTNLDTAAFIACADGNTREWAGLTACEPLTGKFWKTNLIETKEVECLVI